jgi:hypothetical protein
MQLEKSMLCGITRARSCSGTSRELDLTVTSGVLVLCWHRLEINLAF